MYVKLVDANAITIEKEKLYFNFNIIGKIIKNIIEGIVITIVLSDKSITFCTSLVSKYSQIKAKIEVRGKEINIAADQVYLLPISDTTAIIKALNKIFIKKYMNIKY